MKNIHVLATDQPSRLHLGNSGLVLCDLIFNPTTINAQHIYITSDEEIKEGDWHLVWLRDKWEVLNYMPSIGYRKECLGKEVCKIILTTDSDLIKDGVQAIDDDFLEWFVKNPSCEEVEVRKEVNFCYYEEIVKYKIIIPKEEPKQERMYSEEDMAESFMACWKANVPEGFECKLSFKEWFEQFKNK